MRPAGRTAAIVGGGPAGLIAAEHLSAAGVRVTVYDRMPSLARKLLIAGRGGLNLTHAEPFEAFVARYGAARDWLRPMLEAHPPAALVAWAEGLGQAMYTGSSGRMFPRAMKASPLLRAWLARLAARGVTLKTRHEWRGWDGDGALVFATPEGEVRLRADATLLALGGASWPKLGSDGTWTPLLAARGVLLAPLRPSNMGIDIAWSQPMQALAGTPLKNAKLSACGFEARGEAVLTAYGLEGGAVYPLSAAIRDAVAAEGSAALTIDLRPDMETGHLARRLEGRVGASVATRLSRAGFSKLEAALLREGAGRALPQEAERLAAAAKAVRLAVHGVEGLTRAISSAGGVSRHALDERLMLTALPGVFAAGEMLDWEAPTGGYLLQACFATGIGAAEGMQAYLGARPRRGAISA